MTANAQRWALVLAAAVSVTGLASAPQVEDVDELELQAAIMKSEGLPRRPAAKQ